MTKQVGKGMYLAKRLERVPEGSIIMKMGNCLLLMQTEIQLLIGSLM